MEDGLDGRNAWPQVVVSVQKRHKTPRSALLEIYSHAPNKVSTGAPMYIPAWPVLNPASILKRTTAAKIPFPLESSNSAYFYVARNGIYHLMKSLLRQGEPIVLAPDYHHGNEIYAMKAAGAKLRYYPVKKNLDVNLDAIASLCDLEPKPLA